MLSAKYPRLKELIDWGRTFIEDTLLPDLQKRNQEALKEEKATTAFFGFTKMLQNQLSELFLCWNILV